MDAKILIALEGTFAGLGEIYENARQFAPLAERAERQLLAAIEALGSRLRRALRNAALNDSELDSVASEIVALREQWQQTIEGLRASSIYAAAHRAMHDRDPVAMANTLPSLFADLNRLESGTDIYFPVSVGTGRRRQGVSPFVPASECAARIVDLCRHGLQPPTASENWWDRDFPNLTGADEPAAFDTPVTVSLTNTDSPFAAFRIRDEPFVRVFAHQLRGPFEVCVANQTTDMWWETHEEPYPAFRDALLAALKTTGIATTRFDADPAG